VGDGGCIRVEGSFSFGRCGADGGRGERKGPGINDLVAVCVDYLDLLTVADYGCGAAAAYGDEADV
jgi:hypothetical protein